jgi:uncharacterized protein YjdB
MTVNLRRAFRLHVLSSLVLVLINCDDGLSPNERVSTLGAAAGDQQGGIAGQPLAQPLVVRALDGEGRPVRGADVQWQVATGGGTITPATGKTDADGRASASFTLGTGAGEQTATARVDTITVTFRATALAGPAVTLTLTPSPLLLDAIGATGQLTVNARDANNNPITGRNPAWSSTADNIATVVNGVVTAVSPGTARARATLDQATGEAEIRVQPVPATIAVTPPSPTFVSLGQTMQFSASARDRLGNPVTVPAQDYLWSTSNAQIVSVNATGLATAEGNGTAQVRASLGNVTGQATVTVSQVPVSLSVNPKADTLTTAQPFAQLQVTGTDANNRPIVAPTVTWTTSNALIATVTQFGVVNAVANGEVVIRATHGSVSDSARITVRLNAAPKPVADIVAAEKDVQKVVAAPGLLGNDTLGIPPGQITSFGDGNVGGTVTSNAAGATATFGTGGSLRVNADGSLTFMPSAGFTGNFTFNYRVTNSVGSADGLVTIQVGVAPAAVDDAFATGAGTTLTVPAATGALSNDTVGFPAGVVVTFGGLNLGGTVTSFPAGQLVAFGIGGFVRLNADGSLTFTPPTGFTGAFAFQYRLSNGSGTSDATITITVS